MSECIEEYNATPADFEDYNTGENEAASRGVLASAIVGTISGEVEESKNPKHKKDCDACGKCAIDALRNRTNINQ